MTQLDAHHKLYLSLLASLIVFGICWLSKVSSESMFILTWLGYSITHLSLSWITIILVHPMDMKAFAKGQDSNRTLIFFFVLSAALVSLVAVVLLFKSTEHLSGSRLTLHVLLSIAAVVCSWSTVHTLFVFRYAHLYYETTAEGKNKSKYIGGLEFPEEDHPDFLDFTYFSFVIGMTFQVSDVEISSKRIRRLALMHSLVAFAFNTVIVALSINIVSGLISK